MTSETIDDVWIPSVCQMCYNRCGIKVHRVNGVVVKIEGDPDCTYGKGRLCAKGNAGIMNHYNPHRVKVPLKRTNPEKGIGVDPQWKEISWEEALDTVVEKLKKVREEDPRKLVMLSFEHEWNMRFREVWGAAFGTPNTMAGGANYCGDALHPIAFLTQGAFHSDPDLEHCNYLILVGSQCGFMVGEDANSTTQAMSDARTRGMKLVVIDPQCNTAAAKADEWIPIRPGTDGALALAMINVLLNEVGIYDAKYIKKYTNGPYLIGPDGHYLKDKDTNKVLVWDATDGKVKTYDNPDIKDFALEGSYQVNGTSGKPAFQLLKEHVLKYTPEEVAEITTIPAETIRRIAREFGEAARIGSTIVIEGKELPLRPACVHWRKGVNHHTHSMLNCLALQFLNIIVGNIDVPGGNLGTSSVLLPGSVMNRSWGPKEDPDGMLVPGLLWVGGGTLPSLVWEVKTPVYIGLRELFPVATFAEHLSWLNVPNGKIFKLPYTPEVLLHCRSNIMMSAINPKLITEWLKSFAFMISFADAIDETVEFADLVLPDTRYLERLDMMANTEFHAKAGLGDWCYQMRQPVVEPPPGVRDWCEVFFEIADRVGFLRDLYHVFNIMQDLKEPYKLQLDKKYSWEEFCDIWAKSWFGPEHGLEWFKEHSFIKWPRRIEEAYPRIFIKPRIPLYLEQFIKAGEDVKRVTKECGIDWWDVSDYQPLPDWKPCPAYEENFPDYDLYPVPCKLPFHTFSMTTDNIWLNELGEHDHSAYYIRINSQTAKKKGLNDGDLVALETKEGNRVEGQLKLTEAIHPEVLGIAGTFGHWAKELSIAKGKGVHLNTLIPVSLERTDMLDGAFDSCVKVKISRVDRVQK